MFVLKKPKGVFLTIDVAIALMLLIFIISLPFFVRYQSSSDDFNSQLLRAYIQDAATVASSKGYLLSSLDQSNASSSSGLRDVLLATPDSVCAQAAAYGVAVPYGLIGHWRLDEGTGFTAIDSTGLGNEGVIDGSPQYMDSGRAGKALFFNGQTRVITPISEPLADFTVSAWFNYYGVAEDGERILDKKSESDAGFWLGKIGSEDGVWGGMMNGDTLETSGFKSGEWHHLAMTRNGDVFTLFANGQEISSASVSSYPEENSTFSIGAPGSGESSPSWMTGMIDEVRLYNRSLTQDEIALLYNNPSSLFHVFH